MTEFLPKGAEAVEVWRIAPLVTEDDLVSRWLRLNEVSPALVAARDLARAVPPVWLEIFRNKSSRMFDPSRQRLMLPLHDVDGALQALHPYDIMPVDLAKGTTPPPPIQRGLVLANRRARMLLGTPVPRGFGAQELTIVESTLSFLRRAAATDPDPPLAVLGVLPGSWNEEIAQHIPQGTRVTVIARDSTSPTTFYPRIVADLRGHCDVTVQRKK